MLQVPTDAFQTSRYVGDLTLQEFAGFLVRQHPDLAALLDGNDRRFGEAFTRELNQLSWEFEDGASGGRGEAYNAAQKSLGNRAVGMAALLRCLTVGRKPAGPDFRLLDVLGGDGTLARFCRSLPGGGPRVYTADIARYMIEACLAQGLACIRQSATNSLLCDDCLDGVLIAYGSHHLDAPGRRQAAAEACRTLKPGGRFVLHDFEIGGPAARWFDEVVHPYSRTGHPHRHFDRTEMRDILESAGFASIQVVEIDDCFTLHGQTEAQARDLALQHMYDMYDLVGIAGSRQSALPLVDAAIADTLGPIQITADGAVVIATVPRTALVAIGVKPFPKALAGG